MPGGATPSKRPWRWTCSPHRACGNRGAAGTELRPWRRRDTASAPCGWTGHAGAAGAPCWTRRWRRCGGPPGYEPYQEDRGTGLVRHVLVRHSRATGRVLVALVTAAPVLPGARAFVSKVRELCPQVETIVQNINPRRSSAVLGPREKVLWGRGYIEDTLCGVRFRLGASSFYQINPEQTEVLYRTALDGAGLDGTQTVVDAYCGVGTIGLAAAGQARRVLGVEFNPSAARCAAQNARANGAGNARFVCADATAYLQGMAARGERADVVFLDPPWPGAPRSSWVRWTGWGRSGSSTSPATRRRSGGISACWPDGWKARLLQPVDLFPHTEHVECVAVLAKIRGGGT
ncbi:23S rRNA (uracil(1939)-C(5))-methyltransferase RlmD [Flavonifractor plautii]|nr:23S rRNA (uracil(1939)-C(5))-methyltransferase RlmD [Flavonifractor plautii]